MSELKPLYSVEETLRIQTVKLNQQLNKLLEQNTQIIELTAERDNALAQNAELVDQVAKLTGVMQSMADSHLEDGETEAAEQFLVHINKTPTQHLRDRDAEVGRAGFVACAEMMNDACANMNDVWSSHQIDDAANNYAEKVRMGEV